MAPTGSSMPLRSQKKTDQSLMSPAMRPMSTAAHGATKAQGPVMATRPASMPLHIIEGSGLPKRHQRNRALVTAPAAPASMVLAAMIEMRPEVQEKAEPALKPNHPKARMN